MSHIRIQSLRSRRRQEHAPQDHKPFPVIRTEKNADSPYRIQCLKDIEVSSHPVYPRCGKKEEPGCHHRTEDLPDHIGSSPLDQEKNADDDKCYDRDLFMSFSKKKIQRRNTPDTFHRRGHCYGRGKNTVCKERGSSYHGRPYKPPALLSYQAEQRKDPSLTMIVCFHGDQHIFHCCQKSDGPYDK